MIDGKSISSESNGLVTQPGLYIGLERLGGQVLHLGGQEYLNDNVNLNNWIYFSKLSRVEAKVDDYDELGNGMIRWKGVAWFWLSREGDEDRKDLESKIDDVMVIRILQCGDGVACKV
nr:hypothetical protein [Tanacetum cinerariifolium]